MKLHWKVLLWMVMGVVAGYALQFVPAPAWAGATWTQVEGGLQISSVVADGPTAKSRLGVGDVVRAVVLDRSGAEEGRERPLTTPEEFATLLEESEMGSVLWLVPAAGGEEYVEPVPLTLDMEPTSPRARILEPFLFVASIFMSLLKMLIVPIVLSSIVTGVAGVGSMKDLRRLGGKTFVYYLSTSLLAILLGQVLVSLIRPGEGAELGLSPLAASAEQNTDSLWGVFRRMVPENVPSALTSNGAMLQVIFFALLFGFFINKVAEPHSSRMRELFQSFFEVMMRMAEGILSLLPYGVFALMVKVVASTGFGVFKPLLLYMLTVAAALVLHSCVTLPALLKFVGRISPVAWFKSMSPAIMTAFSTSSSTMTLPVTMETVERRGGVSNKVSSFTLPLGATINMDGTALYECIGVIFLAQYYSAFPGFELTFGDQALVVVLALLASIGAAGIPSAGLVMMLTILSTLGLPIEGAALLLAVDRPLDMMRTVTNVWSDSCGAAVIARTEGEEVAMPGAQAG